MRTVDLRVLTLLATGATAATAAGLLRQPVQVVVHAGGLDVLGSPDERQNRRGSARCPTT